MLCEEFEDPVPGVGGPGGPVGEGHGRIEGELVLGVARCTKAGKHPQGYGGDAYLGKEGEKVGAGGGAGDPIEGGWCCGGGDHVVGKNGGGFADHYADVVVFGVDLVEELFG